MNRGVLVIGGGVAGLTAAKGLANRGFRVKLVGRVSVIKKGVGGLQ